MFERFLSLYNVPYQYFLLRFSVSAQMILKQPDKLLTR